MSFRLEVCGTFLIKFKMLFMLPFGLLLHSLDAFQSGGCNFLHRKLFPNKSSFFTSISLDIHKNDRFPLSQTTKVGQRSVAVIGANTKIGQLVSKNLESNGFQPRLIGNNLEWARNLATKSLTPVFIGNIAQNPDSLDFENKMTVCQVKSDGFLVVELRQVLFGVESIVVCPSSTSFPSLSWLSGKSPYQQDVLQIQNIVECMDASSMKRFCYLSAIGADRDLPRIPRLDENLLLSVTNFFGAIGMKRYGEAIVRQACREPGMAAFIVRAKMHCYDAGAFGGPEEEFFESLGYEGAMVFPGDRGDGETSAAAAAGALAHCLLLPTNGPREFTVVNARGRLPTTPADWDRAFNQAMARA